MTTSTASYVFDNDRPTAPDMLDHLSAVLDTATLRRLTKLGIAEGWRCLEVGAGNGSVAAWLAERGADVVATDIKPQHVRPHPGVTVLRHDVSTEELPPGPFHLIHARLLLAHLPQRCDVLFRMVERLAPGGALVIEEWGAVGAASVLYASDPDAGTLFDRYQTALVQLLKAQGNDGGWALRVPTVMVEAGLANVDTELSARSWRGGSAGCMLPVAVARELRDQLVAVGVAPSDLDSLAGVLADPATLLAGNLTVSTCGRQP
jgi:protein-L-isoaspartate O-methyltransferase